VESTRRASHAAVAADSAESEATYLNDDWDAYCDYRIDHETERLYPYREAILVMDENPSFPLTPALSPSGERVGVRGCFHP